MPTENKGNWRNIERKGLKMTGVDMNQPVSRAPFPTGDAQSSRSNSGRSGPSTELYRMIPPAMSRAEWAIEKEHQSAGRRGDRGIALVIIGVLVVALGIGTQTVTGWSLSAFGVSSKLTAATPGMLIIVGGLVLALVAYPKVETSSSPAPPKKGEKPRASRKR